jgi:hypothetical protein
LLVDADFIPSLGLQKQLLQHFAGHAAAGSASNVHSMYSGSTTTALDWSKQVMQQQGDTVVSGAKAGGGTQQDSKSSTEQRFVVVPAFQLQLAAGAVVEDVQQLQVPRTKEQLVEAIGGFCYHAACVTTCLGVVKPCGSCESASRS